MSCALSQINDMTRNEFAHVIGPVFEHSPWIAERSWEKRPFTSAQTLREALHDTVRSASDDEKLALIRAHPDLVGRAVLTSESQSEQAAAGLGELTADEVAAFEKYNSAYRARFGFPFVICARRNKKEAILRAFPERLQNTPAKEIETALREIFQIAEIRLNDLIS